MSGCRTRSGSDRARGSGGKAELGGQGFQVCRGPLSSPRPATARRSLVVDFLGGGKGFPGPVDSTVQKDEAGQGRPGKHDGHEGHSGVVDQLWGERGGPWRGLPGPRPSPSSQSVTQTPEASGKVFASPLLGPNSQMKTPRPEAKMGSRSPTAFSLFHPHSSQETWGDSKQVPKRLATSSTRLWNLSFYLKKIHWCCL